MIKRNIKLLFLLILLMGSIISADSKAEEGGNPVKKVLVVHSYHPEYEWVSNISRGIKRVLESEKDILVETCYLDTLNVQSEDKIIRAGEKAKEIILQWDPDIVITVDDSAQQYVGRFYTGKDRPVIVFCGVSLPIESYGYPASNVTGIIEKSTLKKAIDFLDTKISPIKSLSILSDDSPATNYVLSSVRNDVESLGKKVVSCDIAGSLEQWKSKISDYQKNKSDAILVISCNSVKDKVDGRTATPQEILEWSRSASKIPIFGLYADIADNGGLLGVINSGIEHGREAASIALGLLNGKSINDYPVKAAQGTILLLNKKTAERLGVSLTKELIDNVDVIVGD